MSVSNKAGYANFREFVEPEVQGVADIEKIRTLYRTNKARFQSVRAVGVWAGRYGRFVEALQGNFGSKAGIADEKAKQILQARHHARNSAFDINSCFSAEDLKIGESVLRTSQVDVSSWG